MMPDRPGPVGGVQRRTIADFLAAMKEQGYNLVEVGSRPIRTIEAPEAVDLYFKVKE